MAAMGGDAASAHTRLLAAHQALLADRDTQFDLKLATPPTELPEWAKALGRFLRAVLAPIGHFIGWLFSFLPDAPYARVLVWSILALATVLILWMVVDRIRTGEWSVPRVRRPATDYAAAPLEDDWLPAAAPARKLLAEADALAAAGNYAEAVHLLLRRSIEDIARRRPRFLRPALTSRDIAAAEALPPAARATFSAIARTVERGLFGGRTIDGHDWDEAREAYAAFALPRAWA